MCVYVFMFSLIVETKDEFYEDFEIVINKIFLFVYLYLFGDFNVRIGLDYVFWFLCIGYFGVGKLNENG